MTAQKIITFHLDSNTKDFFGQCDSSTFRDDAKNLIRRMLSRDPSSRPDLLQIAKDPFFSGMDIFSLHKRPAHPLDVGSIAPVADAKWSRRQFSSIWAPQPHAYNIGGSSSNPTSRVGNALDLPIWEGGEADMEFLPTHSKAPMLTKIRE